ncbi:hypothetical protein OG756_31390 [Streptomyces sp. NBC_01310]|uniref:hypothetical protein n=1 Tax=Streptomyces sp. NBC_01310 TaxID=2903820 RepID=UPI0035B60555|nr:hypothetical protein OG756_31390 [Streptomyces sp. NBC_01310]
MGRAGVGRRPADRLGAALLDTDLDVVTGQGRTHAHDQCRPFGGIVVPAGVSRCR